MHNLAADRAGRPQGRQAAPGGGLRPSPWGRNSIPWGRVPKTRIPWGRLPKTRIPWGRVKKIDPMGLGRVIFQITDEFTIKLTYIDTNSLT